MHTKVSMHLILYPSLSFGLLMQRGWKPTLVWLEIHGVYINSSVMDEGALLKYVPYKIEGHVNPAQLH